MTAKQQQSTEDSLRTDLELFQILKPYIGQCLSLNHDLNNPLTGIIGYCEFLLSEPEELSEDQIGYLKQILNCGERIQKIIENLCQVKIALSEKVDLAKVIEAYRPSEKIQTS